MHASLFDLLLFPRNCIAENLLGGIENWFLRNQLPPNIFFYLRSILENALQLLWQVFDVLKYFNKISFPTEHFPISESQNMSMPILFKFQTTDFEMFFFFFFFLHFTISHLRSLAIIFTWHRFTHWIDFLGTSRPNVSHICGQKNSSIKAWGSQTTSIKSLESQTQHKNNCFSVKAKFKLFFRQTSLHQNVKHLVGLVSGY